MADSIYIKKLIDKNIGPLTDIHIDFPFEENGNPKPIIIVGENGSGKSTILSNIVDAFYEMAEKAFTNVCIPSAKNGYQYFKTISPKEIHNGTAFLYSYISFEAENSPKYVFKTGNISVEEFKAQIGDPSIPVSWKADESKKQVAIDESTASHIWENNVICYFGPDRYEKPVWMGSKYYQAEEDLHPTIRDNWTGVLKNPIVVHNVTSSNLQWLLDVIADSRADIEGIPGFMRLAPSTNANSLFWQKQARTNLETILSKILGDDVYFQLNYRNIGGSRFRIVRKSDNSVICLTLDSLSTGQICLFNLFATIVRYADNNNINQSIMLGDITGIVVIDEVDLHLHTNLQKEVLPELLKLFPKIQFIITSHSPLFLLGMKDAFGEDGFEVYELPKGVKIDTEKFSEFRKAYNYLKETETYQQEVKAAINAIQQNEKAMVITEGPTDWKHMKAAFESLRSDGLHSDLFDGLDFDFFEFEHSESAAAAEHKLNMGNSVLCQLCENMAKLPHISKYIFIADRDDENTNRKLSVAGMDYKYWGNNVYSFILPIPAHRSNTPSICIEHYYTDEEIKTEWIDPDTGIHRRLYLGNEFDGRGLSSGIDRFCEKRSKCGPSSIAIIEGSNGEKVTCISEDNGVNYALSKSKFAKMILDRQAPFDNFNFESFVSVFRIIKEIINDNQEATNA